MSSAATAYRSAEPRPAPPDGSSPPRERLDSAAPRLLARGFLAALVVTAASVIVAPPNPELPLLSLVAPFVVLPVFAKLALWPTVWVGADGIIVLKLGRKELVPFDRLVRVTGDWFVGRIDCVDRAPIRFFVRRGAFEQVERYSTAARARAGRPSASLPEAEPLHSSVMRRLFLVQFSACLIIAATIALYVVRETWRSGELPMMGLAAAIGFSLIALFLREVVVGPRVFASERSITVVHGSREQHFAWSEVVGIHPPDLLWRHHCAIEVAGAPTIRFVARRDAVALAARYRSLSRDESAVTSSQAEGSAV